MAKLSQDDLLAQFEEMTLIELSEFVKAFEETFDVTAAAAVAVAAAGGRPVAPPPRPSRSRTSSTSSSTGAGDKKIQVIKVVRELTSLGLKEAKDLVDGAPKPVLEKVDKEAADKAAESLKAPARLSRSSNASERASSEASPRAITRKGGRPLAYPQCLTCPGLVGE